MRTFGKAAAAIGAMLAMTMPNSSSRPMGLSEEGEMLKMSKEDRLKYDLERRKRRAPIRQNKDFNYKIRNKKRRESSKSRRINRVKS